MFASSIWTGREGRPASLPDKETGPKVKITRHADLITICIIFVDISFIGDFADHGVHTFSDTYPGQFSFWYLAGHQNSMISGRSWMIFISWFPIRFNTYTLLIFSFLILRFFGVAQQRSDLQRHNQFYLGVYLSWFLYISFLSWSFSLALRYIPSLMAVLLAVGFCEAWVVFGCSDECDCNISILLMHPLMRSTARCRNDWTLEIRTGDQDWGPRPWRSQ